MIKALQFGIVEFDPVGTRFLLNQTDMNPNITFEEVIGRIKKSRKEYEFLGLAQANPMNYGQVVNKNNFVNSNYNKGSYNRSSSNYKKIFRIPGHGSNRGTMWPFKVPDQEKLQ